ncbi:hypothetical protein [Streptomyces chiangmaiensis]|uniref:SH3 domain-containing protein n=1 Tax=Streptomyces chiangmaiensis TaxID=766497 RepID=A0ABU7FKM3_9ACTN|nr:hypothetical protein [Streptomyces chiangmaiensis]MED7824654.1 hypothetical protein [Streptomyces chiangmaiensis]
MNDHHNSAAGVTRRGLIVGAVAAGLAATGGVATASPSQENGSGPGGRPSTSPVTASKGRLGHTIPKYLTAVPGESVEAGRVDRPVAPGIVLTSFDTFGRTGWMRVHVLNADLGDASVGVVPAR